MNTGAFGWTAGGSGGGGGGITIQTSGVNNAVQTILNNRPSFGMRITNPSSGNVDYEAVVNENKAVYVDLAYGNDLTAEKYNLVRPYSSFASAYSIAAAGDVIVLNAGTYSIGQYSLSKTGVNIYCKPGVVLNNSGFTVSVTLNWRLYGYAIFTGTGATPLNINGSAGAYDIYFEFDKIEGSMNTAIFIKDPLATQLNVLVKGNSISSTSTNDTHLVRIDNSNNIKATIDISQIITGTQRFIVRLGGFSATTPMVGTILINSPVIENTGARTQRACVYLEGVLTSLPSDAYKIVINSDIIRQTNPTMTETGTDVISSCVWIDGGNNIYINSDLDGQYCLAVCNRGAGGTPHYGTIVFEGNMSSRIECISSCNKAASGNGWHSIIVKNGLLITEGRGINACTVVDRPSFWNIPIAGVNGKLQFINCRFYNRNLLANATATCIVSSGDNPNRTFLYDCLGYAETPSTDFIVSSNVTENVWMVNTQSNRDLPVNITDNWGGFTLQATLQVPDY
jgi:hypothetical protein